MVMLLTLSLTFWIPIVSVSAKTLTKSSYRSYFFNLSNEYNDFNKLFKISIMLLREEVDNMYVAKKSFFEKDDHKKEINYEN